MNRWLGWFLTWWGTALLAALDSTILFYLPFGIDALVIYQSARDDRLFWIYPLLATAGAIVGAGVTFRIGRAVGEAGLGRWVSSRRLDALRHRVRDRGAIAIAIPALLPPPFPLTPFILTCGALSVNQWRFFSTFAAARFLRFGVEAFLADRYGVRILRTLEADWFRTVVYSFVVVAVIGTAVSGWLMWRRIAPAPAREAM